MAVNGWQASSSLTEEVSPGFSRPKPPIRPSERPGLLPGSREIPDGASRTFSEVTKSAPCASTSGLSFTGEEEVNGLIPQQPALANAEMIPRSPFSLPIKPTNGTSLDAATWKAALPDAFDRKNDLDSASVNRHADHDTLWENAKDAGAIEGEAAFALFEFAGNGRDELSVKEGEAIVVVERCDVDWWKCRNTAGMEGVIPASWVDLKPSDTGSEKGASSASSSIPPLPPQELISGSGNLNIIHLHVPPSAASNLSGNAQEGAQMRTRRPVEQKIVQAIRGGGHQPEQLEPKAQAGEEQLVALDKKVEEPCVAHSTSASKPSVKHDIRATTGVEIVTSTDKGKSLVTLWEEDEHNNGIGTMRMPRKIYQQLQPAGNRGLTATVAGLSRCRFPIAPDEYGNQDQSPQNNVAVELETVEKATVPALRHSGATTDIASGKLNLEDLKKLVAAITAAHQNDTMNSAATSQLRVTSVAPATMVQDRPTIPLSTGKFQGQHVSDLHAGDGNHVTTPENIPYDKPPEDDDSSLKVPALPVLAESHRSEVTLIVGKRRPPPPVPTAFSSPIRRGRPAPPVPKDPTNPVIKKRPPPQVPIRPRTRSRAAPSLVSDMDDTSEDATRGEVLSIIGSNSFTAEKWMPFLNEPPAASHTYTRNDATTGSVLEEDNEPRQQVPTTRIDEVTSEHKVSSGSISVPHLSPSLDTGSATSPPVHMSAEVGGNHVPLMRSHICVMGMASSGPSTVADPTALSRAAASETDTKLGPPSTVLSLPIPSGRPPKASPSLTELPYLREDPESMAIENPIAHTSLLQGPAHLKPGPRMQTDAIMYEAANLSGTNQNIPEDLLRDRSLRPSISVSENHPMLPSLLNRKSMALPKLEPPVDMLGAGGPMDVHNLKPLSNVLNSDEVESSSVPSLQDIKPSPSLSLEDKMVNLPATILTTRAQPSVEIAKDPELECAICLDGSWDIDFPAQAPTSACTHLPEVCIDCLQNTISQAIQSGKSTVGISCPSVDCSQRLGYWDVNRWAAPEAFKKSRYDSLLLRKALLDRKDHVFCLKAGCDASQDHVGGEENCVVICHSCGTKHCFIHKVLWHDEFTCQQWDEHQKTMKKNQELTEGWIKKETKVCPGPGCGRRIQKDEDGCSHVLCNESIGGCGHEFCWECLASHKDIVRTDNSKHYDHCKYYSGLPGKNPAPTESLPSRQADVEAVPPREMATVLQDTVSKRPPSRGHSHPPKSDPSPPLRRPMHPQRTRRNIVQTQVIAGPGPGSSAYARQTIAGRLQEEMRRDRPHATLAQSNVIPQVISTNFIAARKLHSLLNDGDLNVLLLDVRGREEFDRERINHDTIVCLEPSSLTREGINASTIEAAQAASPPTEGILFNYRSRFDVIVVYDECTNGSDFLSSPMSHLARAISKDVRRPLKHPPLVLRGGYRAWRSSIGEEGISRTACSKPSELSLHTEGREDRPFGDPRIRQILPNLRKLHKKLVPQSSSADIHSNELSDSWTLVDMEV